MRQAVLVTRAEEDEYVSIGRNGRRHLKGLTVELHRSRVAECPVVVGWRLRCQCWILNLALCIFSIWDLTVCRITGSGRVRRGGGVSEVRQLVVLARASVTKYHLSHVKKVYTVVRRQYALQVI